MKTDDQFCRYCMLPFCSRSGGSIAKKCRGVPGVAGTLRKANSHFNPTQRGSGPHHHVEAAVDWFRFCATCVHRRCFAPSESLSSFFWSPHRSSLQARVS